MGSVIKQIIPIPEGLTAMTRCQDDNGKKYYIDAIAAGQTVMYALEEDEENGDALVFYTADCNGIGDLEEFGSDFVLLAPTVHCKKCGRRMMASTNPGDTDTVVYHCVCGESVDDSIFYNK